MLRSGFSARLATLVLLTALASAAPLSAGAQTTPGGATPTPARDVDLRPYTGDFDGMLKKRLVRALVVPTKTQYWVERGTQQGIEYELLTAFETELNRKYKMSGNKYLKIRVAFIPVGRDELIPALRAGKGDIAAAGLTVTEERLTQVYFAAPFFRGVREIAVTGPRSPKIATVDDLAGKEVFVRRSSSYWQHLAALAERFKQAGKAPVTLRAAPEDLQDDDLLEMLNAGLVGIVVVDAYIARLWSQVLPSIKPHPEIAVATGGEIGWMIRKGSARLKAEIDAFAGTHGQGTAFGNTVLKKYAADTRFVKNATTPEELAKFNQAVELFRKYGEQYSMDYLLMMAQGYQESRLDQSARSPVGAIGMMQIMPATGAQMNVGDIKQLEANVHAGVKYMRFMIDHYYAKEPMTRLDRGLFAFAAYNAGPGRMNQLRREAKKRGLDPNVWFNNVELVAADRIGPETVTYVSNIYKYYIAYTLVAENEADRRKALEEAQKAK